jgi:hypothetical protein
MLFKIREMLMFSFVRYLTTSFQIMAFGDFGIVRGKL